jgi:ATP-dependent DNA helicase RecG
MSKAFKRLKGVLKLESDQGYQNKAVVGGIRQFAAFWVGQAREEAVDEADRALIEQVAEVLTEYGRLPGVEARASTIDALMGHLSAREERVKHLVKEIPAQAPVAVTQSRKPAPVKKAPPARQEEPEPQVQESPDPEGLQQSVSVLHGVGPKMAQSLERVGATTLWELLYIFPRRYDDYTLLKPINRMQFGEQVTVIGTVWEVRARQGRNHKLVPSLITA